MKFIHSLVGLTLALTTGCSTLEYPIAHHLELEDGVASLSYTADIRATHLLKREDGSYWVLSEPAPDAAFSYDDEQDLNLSLVKIGGNEGGKEESVSGAADLPLPGRASYLLFARELMFRVNEMAYNSKATPEQYQKAFFEALKAIQAVAEIEAANVKTSWSVDVRTGSNASMSVDTEVLGSNTKKEPATKSGSSDESSDDSSEDDEDDN
ncbi:MAG: hypothetical protein GY697_06675 [Desulfobacterales bacterium]|nr:hypothetical protein [Desulfobacterales bacterium]